MQISFDISDIDFVHADKIILLFKWLSGGRTEMPRNLAWQLELIEWLEDVENEIMANLDAYDWEHSMYEPVKKAKRYTIRQKAFEQAYIENIETPTD